MKNNRIAVCFIFILILSLLSSCSNIAESLPVQTIIEMELTQNYDNADPFINEKLVYVSDSVDTLNLDVSFQMEGESGILEIADNETKQVIWSYTWNEDVDNTAFTISLDDLDKENEYVVRFIGTKIKYAKITITSKNSLVKEREQPQKPSEVSFLASSSDWKQDLVSKDLFS